jgi:hypothetical protein
MSGNNKKVFILWLKIILISWLIFSTILYFLSGNVLVFYAIGIILLAGGIPYLVIHLSRNKKEK